MLKQDVAEAWGSGSDSYHDTSNNSRGSIEHLENPDNQTVSKKRKGANLQTPPSQYKRARANYNDEYRQLYNETINDIVRGSSSDRQELLSPSQIGITLWSSQEKDRFFAALGKRGRDDLRGIAAAIGTKSEFEVHVYLQLLHDAVVRQHLHSPRNHLFDISAAPGAFEVSPECCAVLELSADALCVLQEKTEVKWERKTHDDLWLLNRKLGRWASSCLRRGDEGETEVRERLPAAELLDLESFLKLSADIFMNSSVKDENWREYSCRSEKPSIRFTAFADFHRLVVSITQRVIQSSVFLAMSRRRATTTANYTPKPAVRKQDITAALNILGMKHNSRSFWAGVAKRCTLDVYDEEEEDVEDGFSRPLSFSEVEKRLSQGDMKDQDDDRPRNHETDDIDEAVAAQSNSSSSSSFEGVDDFSDIISDSSYNQDFSARSHSPASSPSYDPDVAGQSSRDFDIHADALDMKASLQEEQRLWDLLNKQPPAPLNPAAISIPRAPPRERKKGDDLDDWRAWTEYAPEWETYVNPVSFTNHRKLLDGPRWRGRRRRKKKKKEKKRRKSETRSALPGKRGLPLTGTSESEIQEGQSQSQSKSESEQGESSMEELATTKQVTPQSFNQ